MKLEPGAQPSEMRVHLRGRLPRALARNECITVHVDKLEQYQGYQIKTRPLAGAGIAQLVARLEHPYIVPLYDFWRDPEGAYLVMRLIRGGTVQPVDVSRIPSFANVDERLREARDGAAAAEVTAAGGSASVDQARPAPSATRGPSSVSSWPNTSSRPK